MSARSAPIRVLIVDDSVVMRRLLSEVIAADPEMQVAGYAANGQIALSLLSQVAPDIITLDIEMPVMDGLSTLRAVRASGRNLPVIMFSTLTERGAEATIESLALGASDYVAKPASGGSYAEARERIRAAVVPKIKALCGRPERPSPEGSPNPARVHPLHGVRRSDPINVVTIGSSTGGPNALAQILPHLSAASSAPILIVQHMPPAFTRFLAQRLASLVPLPVEEAEHNAILRPGRIWVAPGGHHLVVGRAQGTLRLCVSDAPPENSCRPSVDVLFRSVAQTFSNRVLAVVLTGMGQDGLRGCELLASAGAEIVVQDEASSVVWGMPGFVAKAGLADAVLPLPDIGPYIMRRLAARATPLLSADARVAAVAP